VGDRRRTRTRPTRIKKRSKEKGVGTCLPEHKFFSGFIGIFRKVEKRETNKQGRGEKRVNIGVFKFLCKKSSRGNRNWGGIVFWPREPRRGTFLGQGGLVPHWDRVQEEGIRAGVCLREGLGYKLAYSRQSKKPEDEKKLRKKGGGLSSTRDSKPKVSKGVQNQKTRRKRRCRILSATAGLQR